MGDTPQWTGTGSRLLVKWPPVGAGPAIERRSVMPLPAHLRSAKPLGQIVDHLDELTASGWLYIRAGVREVNFATECYAVEIDSRQVSEEEMVAFETAAAAAGFKSFLCDDQLREINGNLQEQRPNFTRADLEKAIDFYWRRDAFILLDGDAA